MDGNISGGVLAAEKIQELIEKKFDLPHTANYAGLLIDSQEVPSSEVFNASPSLNDKETHFDPIQCPEKQETEANNLRPAVAPVQLTP
ncbi:hypothetical protein K443DRAFT_7367 [Laccaria amethystina LaAM-08-1]|uniref:Unplaced genomic scaffold K443scaffold_82, whole genome shotgun sequence n=1 Tax=Laccaria amethystina LaAM-08-1 TaxID=1095629 RepID=A0A0C9XT05_9AGAR|nr:hypothetical protein K443DRAFT_7367 [Laccaria amethystina LaAM-08-1]